MSIESAIRRYLDSHGIKQSFVADKCGWSKQKANAILTGKQRISANEYRVLCEAINVPYDYFYNVVATQNSAGSERSGQRVKTAHLGGREVNGFEIRL